MKCLFNNKARSHSDLDWSCRVPYICIWESSLCVFGVLCPVWFLVICECSSVLLKFILMCCIDGGDLMWVRVLLSRMSACIVCWTLWWYLVRLFCSVAFDTPVGVSVLSVMWSKMLLIFSMICSLWLSVYDCYSVEWAFISCGTKFVMYCMLFGMFVSIVVCFQLSCALCYVCVPWSVVVLSYVDLWSMMSDVYVYNCGVLCSYVYHDQL